MRIALDYLTGALAHSASSRPDLLVTQAGEALEQLNQFVEQAYVDAALANPPTFNGQADVPYTLSAPVGGAGIFSAVLPAGWLLPSDCNRVYRLEMLSLTTGVNLTDWPEGSEILPVQPHNKTGNRYQPCVAELGRAFIVTGVPGHPTGGSIRMLYGGRPVPMTSLSATIDSRWMEAHDHIFEMLMATWFAAKDGRTGDAQQFAQDSADDYARFLAAIDSPVAVTREIMQRFRRNLLTQVGGADAVG